MLLSILFAVICIYVGCRFFAVGYEVLDKTFKKKGD